MKLIQSQVGIYTTFKTENGLYHREDGPAKFTTSDDRTEEIWYYLGKIHRIKGPAMSWLGYYWEIGGNNYKYGWYKNSECHRLNAPALIRWNGTKEYYEFDLYIK